MHNHAKKVIIGMSGGVDSSVAALLLLKQGYAVEGLFMKNWEEDDQDGHCSASVDLADAQAVCDHLGIKLHKINFAAEYWDRVFSNFLQEYSAGRTPNPDILCNKEIKFKAFLDYALHLGADYIATGHYAGISYQDGVYQLLKATDQNKDQSYFLYTLGQQQLSKALFPLATIDKTTVRQIASKAGYLNCTKKDSTGICFIGERKFKDFLQKFLPAIPGEIITEQGQVLGQHDGLMYYTLGQRQGLNIGGRADTSHAPWFVLAKDLANNQLIVGQGTNHPRLFATTLRANNLSWVHGCNSQILNCTAKIRYRQQEQTCTVKLDDSGGCIVNFLHPQRAITPGQSVVFYAGDECLGGGIIEGQLDV